MKIQKIKGGGSSSTIYIIIIAVLSTIIVVGLYTIYTTPFTKSPKMVQSISIKNDTPPTDPFYDIHAPPLRNNPYMTPPSNSTSSFSQIGILKQDGNILPLFGRLVSRDLWQYYTVSNTGTYPGIKLPLFNEKGKSLMNDTGSHELYNDDTVTADGYDNKKMTVTIYDQKQFQYI
jgi:hypothetical protein